MKIKNYLAGLVLAAGSLAYSPSLEAEITPTNEQQVKIDRAIGEIYRDKQEYRGIVKEEDDLSFDIFFPMTVLGFTLFTEKYIRGRK